MNILPDQHKPQANHSFASLATGEFRQCHRGVPPLPDNQDAEAGTILATAWAKTRLGRRRRIKVELFAANSSEAEQASQKTPSRARGAFRPQSPVWTS